MYLHQLYHCRPQRYRPPQISVKVGVSARARGRGSNSVEVRVRIEIKNRVGFNVRVMVTNYAVGLCSGALAVTGLVWLIVPERWMRNENSTLIKSLG